VYKVIMIRVLLISACLVGALPALAQAPPKVFLEDMTWTELRDAIQGGATTMLVPIGGTEENGPHMALGKHNVRVKLLAERIARGLGNAIVAPVIAYVPEGGFSPPTQHMRFPGTITIPEPAFIQTLESAAQSFKAHGIRDIVFLGDHGGYQAAERQAADHLNREWAATPARAHALAEYYRASQDDFTHALEKLGYRRDEIGSHAGLADTSFAMAVAPGLVRTEYLRSGQKPSAADGVYGDPRRSTAALGQLAVDATVSKSIDAIKAAIAHR
jgi:creatinine amidohydrolase